MLRASTKVFIIGSLQSNGQNKGFNDLGLLIWEDLD